MTDPCDRCDGEGKDCVGCSHKYDFAKENQDEKPTNND